MCVGLCQPAWLIISSGKTYQHVCLGILNTNIEQQNMILLPPRLIKAIDKAAVINIQPLRRDILKLKNDKERDIIHIDVPRAKAAKL